MRLRTLLLILASACTSTAKPADPATRDDFARYVEGLYPGTEWEMREILPVSGAYGAAHRSCELTTDVVLIQGTYVGRIAGETHKRTFDEEGRQVQVMDTSLDLTLVREGDRWVCDDGESRSTTTLTPPGRTMHGMKPCRNLDAFCRGSVNLERKGG
jgi:hypothetical protein